MEQEESVRRQLNRAALAAKHNTRVLDAGAHAKSSRGSAQEQGRTCPSCWSPETLMLIPFQKFVQAKSIVCAWPYLIVNPMGAVELGGAL